VSDGKLATTNNFTLVVTPVNDAPVFVSTPTNIVVRRGQTTAPQAFSVNDVDNFVDTLDVSAVSASPALVSIGAIGGSGPNRTISVISAAGQSGSSTITLSVSDGILTSPTTFTVQVNE